MTTHAAFPNLFRPERWEGEENHFRSTLKVGDIVRTDSGRRARITAWNNTWSHIRGGRIACLDDLEAEGIGRDGAWENTLVRVEQHQGDR